MEINRKLISIIPETPRIVAKEVLHVYAVANPVLQTLGDSTAFAMSQKAVTDAILQMVGIVDYDGITNIPIVRVANLPETPTKKYYQYIGKDLVNYVYNGIYYHDGSKYVLLGRSNIDIGSGANSLIQHQDENGVVSASGIMLSPATASGKTAAAFNVATAKGDGSFGANRATILEKESAAFNVATAGKTLSEFNAYYWSSAKNQPLHGGKGKDAQGNILDEEGNTYNNGRSSLFAFATGSAKAYGPYSMANNYGAKATGFAAVAFNVNTQANGDYSASFGSDCRANGKNAFAAGNNSYATGNHSAAFNYETSASGSCSFTANYLTQATGTNCSAFGDHTFAHLKDSFVIGRYNNYYESSMALFQVGNGSAEAISNAFSVDRDGRCYAGRSTSKSDGNTTLTTKDYVENLVAALEQNGGSGNSGIPTVYRAGDGISIVGNTISTELKTVNGQSLPGEGNIDIDLDIHASDYYGSAVVEKTTKTLFLNDDLFGRNKEKLSKLVIDGNGKSFLANDGTYKEFTVTNDSTITVDTVLSSNSMNAIANATVYHKFSEYVPKQPGKQLSTEDFTTAFKTKLQNAKIYVDISTSTLKIRL